MLWCWIEQRSMTPVAEVDSACVQRSSQSTSNSFSVRVCSTIGASAACAGWAAQPFRALSRRFMPSMPPRASSRTAGSGSFLAIRAKMARAAVPCTTSACTTSARSCLRCLCEGAHGQPSIVRWGSGAPACRRRGSPTKGAPHRSRFVGAASRTVTSRPAANRSAPQRRSGCEHCNLRHPPTDARPRSRH